MDAKGELSTKVYLSENVIILEQLTAQERYDLVKWLLAGDEGNAEVEAHQMLPPGMGSYEFTKRYQEDLLRDARNAQMVKEALAGKPSFFSRLEIRLGKFMIATGKKLMIQAQPVRKSTAAAD